MKEFNQLCLKEYISNLNTLTCSDKSLQSPLDLLKEFGLKSKTDFLKVNFDQVKLNKLLNQAILNTTMWSKYSKLFDIKVTARNLFINYMRTVITLAGPILANPDDQGSKYANTQDR